MTADEQEAEWARAREAMVHQVRAYGVKNERVLAAMRKVRRHRFIPEEYRCESDLYGDHPNPIGLDQTISQPFIVAYMTEYLDIRPGMRVLEVGTGSGYQAAVLAELGAVVYSIEILAPLAGHARHILEAEGYMTVHVLCSDGYRGWIEHAPFDAILATCAPDEVPRALTDQLGEDGRMILPVGAGFQRLVILRRKDGKLRQQDDIAVRFVPMIHGGIAMKTEARFTGLSAHARVTKQRGRFTITGRVQGVCFRMDAREVARKLGLTGWVRNCPDGSVEIVAEGEETAVKELLKWCRTGPPQARVQHIRDTYSNATGEFEAFEIAF